MDVSYTINGRKRLVGCYIVNSELLVPGQFFNWVDRNIILLIYNHLAESDNELQQKFNVATRNGSSKCYFNQLTFRLICSRISKVTRQLYQRQLNKTRATIGMTFFNERLDYKKINELNSRRIISLKISELNSRKIISQKHNISLKISDGEGKWKGIPKKVMEESVLECDKKWLHNHKTEQCHCKSKHFERKPKNAKGNHRQIKQETTCQKRNHRGRKINHKRPGKSKKMECYDYDDSYNDDYYWEDYNWNYHDSYSWDYEDSFQVREDYSGDYLDDFYIDYDSWGYDNWSYDGFW